MTDTILFFYNIDHKILSLFPNNKIIVFGNNTINDNEIITYNEDPLDVIFQLNLIRNLFITNVLVIPNKSTILFDMYLNIITPNGYIVISKDHDEVLQNIKCEEYPWDFEIVERGDYICIKKINISNIKFGIIIPTYKRPNGKSKAYVERCLNSINKQTYTNYCVYLRGDKYEDKDEFEAFKNLLPEGKINIFNEPIAWERENCKIKDNLWTVGGVTTLNNGIKALVRDEYIYYCCLDDDDYWHPNHLYNIAWGYNKYNADFITTQCVYLQNDVLPRYAKLDINNFIPRGEDCCHSSQSWNITKITYLYHTVENFDNEVEMMPGDKNMLIRIGQLAQKKQITTLLIPYITCFHEQEGESRK